jgi:hypothetical protein
MLPHFLVREAAKPTNNTTPYRSSSKAVAKGETASPTRTATPICQAVMATACFCRATIAALKKKQRPWAQTALPRLQTCAANLQKRI